MDEVWICGDVWPKQEGEEEGFLDGGNAGLVTILIAEILELF